MPGPARYPPPRGRPLAGIAHHRAAAAGDLPHLRGAAGAERGVVRGLLQRVRRGLLAALERPHRGAAAPAAGGQRAGWTSTAPRPTARRSSSAAWCWNGPGRAHLDLELDLRPFEDGGWYWFDLTTDEGELTLVEGGWYAEEPGRGRAAVTIGMPTFNRPADCVATLTAIGEDPLVLAAVVAVILPDQGTKKVRDAAGLRAGGGGARRPAAHHRPAQPRRLRRLRPGDVRGARAHRLRADPLHGRRHPARARLGAAGRRVLPLLPRADAGRRADAVAAGAVPAVDDGRGRRPATPSSGATRRAPSRTTTSPSARCGRPAGCTAAPTSTTTPGGCA